MNSEFFEAIAQLEKEKGIPKEYIFEKIAQALATAYRRDNDGVSDNIAVELDEKKREMRMYIKKTVVEEVEAPGLEISVSEAREYAPGAVVGDVVNISVPTKNFGRIAAQTAKQVIIQGLREAERGIIFSEYTSKEHEIISGIVSRIDSRGGALLEIGGGTERTEALLPAGEQIKGEALEPGDRLKVYVTEVKRANKGPQIMVSRTHPGLVRRLFELEVPEINEGLVEIKSVAREPGSRTKLAVLALEENIDPIGACIGPRGGRVAGIVSELGGEKIDIVRYYDDIPLFVSESLAPARVIEVVMLDEEKSCRAIVPDDELSLAIGREGQNVRLAAKLTGIKVDIKPESKRFE